MPDLIADCFDALGEDMADWLDLVPVAPLYRSFHPDGSRIDVHADPEAMAAELRRTCGPAEAAGFERYVAFVTRLYRYEMRDFIDRNIDSPADLLTPNLARIAAIGGFRRLAPKVARYLRDERTQKLFSFQAMYAGLSPYQALALYAVIAYMDSVAGVFFPRGGVHALPTAMAAAAEKHGVEFRYGTEVTRVEHRGGRASSCSTPTCPWHIGSCSAARRGQCAGCATRRPATCCSPARADATTTAPTTRSRSAPAGGRCSRSCCPGG
jgi:phytoene desaturase